MRYDLILFLAAALPIAGHPGHQITQNEARTIEFLQTLLAAEQAYALANAGLFDEPRCLAAPGDCIHFEAGVPQPFLDPALAGLPPRHGYRFRFHPGPAIPKGARAAAASASSLDRFAITAIPLHPGVSGRRRFCVDHAGFVHESEHTVLVDEEGACSPTSRIAREPIPASPAEAEARIIADLRVLVAAQGAYASSNMGFFDELRCLAAPATCIPRWNDQPPSFLDPAFARLPPRHGYRLLFRAGPPPEAERPALSSASSMLRFSITAVPLHPATGLRRLCVDQDGLVRTSDTMGALLAKAGGCARTARIVDDPPPSSLAELESRVIADLRILLSAQEAYASANGGFFDRLDCLAEPWRCLSGWNESMPLLLDPRIASLRERYGYRRRFYPGPPAPYERRVPYLSATSMSAYAYTAVPANSGSRGFCTDSRGVLCQTSDGREPPVVNAQCEPCEPVR
jgi:hypothetical protein